MRVLVTGGAGFIGSNLCRRLLKDNFEVNIVSRKSSNLWRIEEIKNEINCHDADLLQFPKLCKIMKNVRPDWIFHLATYGAYPRIQNEEQKILQTNVVGTGNLLKASLRTNFECFVNTGSSSEYGEKSGPMKESDILEPDTYYGICKAASTMLCSDFAKKNSRNIVTLRHFSVYGYYEENFRLVPHVIMRCLQNKDVELTSGGQKRDFVFIEDAIESYLKATKLQKQNGEIFNVGSGKDATVKQICLEIKNRTKSKNNLLFGAKKRENFETDLSWKADTSKSKKLLKWEAKTGLMEGIKKSVQWFKKNNHLYKNIE